ncbi:cyclin-J18 isoform X2 [Apium graveolens]|uniref:cyclin-J18 isoform X2 n=1 Tax=Apium graveolens TaxID=4045 RepID=UPI003D78CBD1
MSPEMRVRVLGFLIQTAQELQVSPIVKYSALSLFADRFYRSLSSFTVGEGSGNWLLQPIRESNLQLFALISIWISSKIHDSGPISVKRLKSLGDKTIQEQHFTIRDFLEAVLNFDIGTLNTAFIFLEDLIIQFKGVARVGKQVNFEACMEIMDICYEKEQTSILFSSPISLAASILVASYVITTPKQRWEFPVIPWVKFVTSCKEADIAENVKDILKHIFETSADK